MLTGSSVVRILPVCSRLDVTSVKMAAEDGEKVQLHVYDLTGGMAMQMSPMLLGRQIDGVWHSGVVVGGVEYFFGGGVQQCAAGATPFGRATKIIDVGRTQIPKDMRDDMIADLKRRFVPEAYNLITNNCNHFSNELALLLTGNAIPDDIVHQARDLMQTPIGQMLLPMMQQMEAQLGNVTAQGFQGPPGGRR